MRFKFLELMGLLRLLLPVLRLPPWDDGQAVRLWVMKLLGLADTAADLTPTPVDDAIVDAARKIVEDQKTWDAVYSLVVDLVGTADSGLIELDADNVRIAKLADDAKISPAIIIAIITAVMELLKWWRGRRDNA